MIGPAHAPLPTSSMPTTNSWPSSHRARSTESFGTFLFGTRLVGSFLRAVATIACDRSRGLEGSEVLHEVLAEAAQLVAVQPRQLGQLGLAVGREHQQVAAGVGRVGAALDQSRPFGPVDQLDGRVVPQLQRL